MEAAKVADYAFARNRLQELLRLEDIAFKPFNKYNEIEEYMVWQGWL